ncbi:dTDP-4-amino-4,6-dideoxygalactose transaminase [Candidatus Uhrbacteria bacterium]|nr:dTDP-4-amino-4,6-dideoxygalactose transaminase [Candidatus Uhrbacteria bacterium]
MRVPFNIPYLTGKEEEYILAALKSRAHCGNNEFSKRCIAFMKKKYGFSEVFLNTSCSTAMEMGAMLAGVGPGDEVILPSYTFSSTANAVLRQGARPVFCEIEPDTMNIDVAKINALITKKTKMIIPVDYAGIPCDIDPIMEIAHRHNLIVMVDAAQSFHSFYKGKPAAAIPDLAAFSFHETKNVTCGEGGALVVNKPEWIERAHFLQEKGTDRKLVLDGVKNKYQWVDIGSSFLLSDILAAMLLAQIEEVENMVQERAKLTFAYYTLLEPYEKAGRITIPHPPAHTEVNHHAFFVIFDIKENRQRFLALLREKEISAYIGYVPLHSSTMGLRLGYKPEDLPLTEDIGSRIVRLPFYTDLPKNGMDYCITEMKNVLSTLYEH